MPVSLSKKLSNRPSRSYLAGISENGTDAGGDTGSVRSFMSGGSQQPAARAGSVTGSVSRGKYGPSNLTPATSGGLLRARGSAASDIGASTSRGNGLLGSSTGSNNRNSYSSLGPLMGDGVAGGASGGRSSAMGRNISGSRRSVTFSDMGPTMLDDRDRLEVMSDIGGYAGYGGASANRHRTPSIASSIMSGGRDRDDAGSDAGSTMSATRRGSTRRGSKSDRVVQAPASLDLWHRDLGGPGMVRKSATGGTVISTSNPLSSIVKRKSTTSKSYAASETGSPTSAAPSSPTKRFGASLIDAQPSRRYSVAPSAQTQSGSGDPTRPQDVLTLPSDASRHPGLSRSHSNSSNLSNSSYMRARSSGYEGSAAGQQQMQGQGTGPFQSPPALHRSLSSGSTSSRKSARSGTGRPAAASSDPVPPVPPISSELRNAASPPVSPSKRKTRTPEQIVEALARAGMLDRMMEVVEEAEEESDPAPVDVIVTGPTPSSTSRNIAALTTDAQQGVASNRTQTEQQVPPTATSQPAYDAGLPAPVATASQAPASAPSTHSREEFSPDQQAIGQASQLAAAQLAIQAAARAEQTAYAQSPSFAPGLSTLPTEVAPPAPLQLSSELQPAPQRENRDSVTSTDSRPYTPGLNDQFVTPPSSPPDSPMAAPRSAGEGGFPLPQQGTTGVGRREEGLPSAIDPNTSPASRGDAPRRASSPGAQAELPAPFQLEPIAKPQHSPGIVAQQPAQPQQTFAMLFPAGTFPPPYSASSPLRLESLSLSTTMHQSHAARSLAGTILVLSSGNAIAVYARLTSNCWTTYEEVSAAAAEEADNSEAEHRRYSFIWHLPPGTGGADVQLALRLEDTVTNQAHWDNNGGQNYAANIPAQPRTPNVSRQPSLNAGAPPADSGRHGPAGMPQQSIAASATGGANAPPSTQSRPTVFLTRTLSDETDSPDVLFDPKRASIISTASGYGPAAYATGQTASDQPSTGLPQIVNGHIQQDQQQQQPSDHSQYMPVSQLPFPAQQVSHAPLRSGSIAPSTVSSSAGTTPTASINGDARATPATTVSTMQQGFQPTAIPRHVLQEKASAERVGPVYGNGSPRAQSTASHASVDSTNQPFHHPSRSSSISASSQHQHHMYPRRGRASMEFNQQDMPSIMSALDQHPQIADDLSHLYGNGRANGAVPRLETGLQSIRSDNGSAGTQAYGAGAQAAAPARGAMRVGPSNAVSGSAIAANVNALPTNSSTMRALTVTSNATQTLNKNFFRGSHQQKSLRQNPAQNFDLSSGKMSSNATISFGNLAPLPLKIRSDECLVHVLAAAVDFWDRAKVEILNARGQGYGFIPGRAFVGKVIETGSDVEAAKVRKGEFVYGLQDLKKSGTLGEYVAVQRRLLARAPDGVLSLEQIAAVALSGIPAYQAMDELCSTLPRGSKLVILNAHEGVGAIALQLGQSLRAARDLWVVAHYPPDFADGDTILRALGASETLCGEVISAVQSLRESSYDAVLDSVGGRKIYDVCKVILHDDGYFVTTVGDALSVPTPKAQWKLSLRAMFKRSEKKKNIAYWFPSLETDARTALDRLRELSESGQLKPVVRRVYKFEDGANAFKGAKEQGVIMLLDQDKYSNGTA